MVAGMVRLREKWLWVALLLPTILMAPVLLWPHYGLFSDAGQAITFPREVLGNLPQSLLLLRPLEDGRWNPLFHGLTILVYAIAPDSPRAMFLAQWGMFVGAVISMGWVVVNTTRSNFFAALGVVLFCFGSAVFENFFTLDKVEPRITLFSALATLLLAVRYLNPVDDIRTRPYWGRFIVLQAVLGVLTVFSKESGMFLAAALVGTWVACRFNPQWGQRLREAVGIAAVTHVVVAIVFVVLFKLLSGQMSYRYVKYDVTVALVSRNLMYYMASSPELLLGLLCACYWCLASLWRRLPGPSGGVRVILVFTSLAQFAYVVGLSMWRWALDYYMLPAQFMASLTLVLTVWTLLPVIRERRTMVRIGAGLAIMVWLSFVAYRLFLGGAIYAQDAVKDRLAQLLSAPEYYSLRLALPFDHPDNAEIGERLEFFIDRERPQQAAVDIYNFWEIPFLNRDNLQRFSGSVGISPGMRQLIEVTAKPEKYVLWKFGSMPDAYIEVMKRTLGGRSEDIGWSPEDIWHASYLRAGDILLVPVGGALLKNLRARGVRLYGQGGEDFLHRTPLQLSRLGGVRSSLWLAELGWDVFRVERLDEYDQLARLLTTNAKKDITPDTATATLFDEHRLPENGLLLGKGWFELEGAGNTRFRWIGIQSEIVLTHLRPGACVLEIDMEPALPAGSQPFVLMAKASGHSMDNPMQGRQTIRFEFRAGGSQYKLLKSRHVVA